VTRCAHCPVAEGSPCLGETAPELFPDFCRMAESGNAIQRRHIVGRSAIGLTSTPMPGLFERVATFAGAVAQHVAAGGPKASPEQVEARLAICRGCEFYEAERVRCLKCGCYLAGDLMGKTSWAEQSCPLDPPKWGPVSPGQSTQQA
jgi:hypothetical protein